MLSGFVISHLKSIYNYNLNHYFEKGYTGFIRCQRDLGTKKLKYLIWSGFLRFTSNHFASWLKCFTSSYHWPYQSTNCLRRYTRHVMALSLHLAPRCLSLPEALSLQPFWNTCRIWKALCSLMTAFMCLCVCGGRGDWFGMPFFLPPHLFLLLTHLPNFIHY